MSSDSRKPISQLEARRLGEQTSSHSQQPGGLGSFSSQPGDGSVAFLLKPDRIDVGGKTPKKPSSAD